MASSQPKPAKLDVDAYLATALSSTPAELHPYFQAFQDLHSRKYVFCFHTRGSISLKSREKGI